MLMVIFGAGASYDSSPDFPPPQPHASVATQNFGSTPAPLNEREAWRPPCANNLFRDPNNVFGHIVRRYPKLNPILSSLRQPVNGSVEEQLELLQVESKEYQEGLREFASVRFYLHDLLFELTNKWWDQTSGVTNYSPLIREILRLQKSEEPVCLVTFNYDVLLDRALESFDYKPQAPKDHFKAHKVLKLFRPHGSVDWVRLFNAPSRGYHPQYEAESVIQMANAAQPLDEFDRILAGQFPPQSRPFLPAIAIPFQTKTEDTFEWPKSHRAYLEELLPSITRILIIGWQAKEAHFLKLLREKLPKGGITQITHLQVVGRDSKEAAKISEQFIADIGREVKKLPTAAPAPAQGFSNFVRQGQVGFFFKD